MSTFKTIKTAYGFTLMELMIAVAIIGVLAGIAVPSYQSYVQTSQHGATKQNAVTLSGFEQVYFYENDTFLAGEFIPGTNGLAALGWEPSGDDDRFKYKVEAGDDCGNDITKCYTITVTLISDPSITQTLSWP